MPVTNATMFSVAMVIIGLYERSGGAGRLGGRGRPGQRGGARNWARLGRVTVL